MIRRWFVPTWSGDFRLVSEAPDRCTLSVTDPVESEVEILEKLVVQARKKGWISKLEGIAPKGTSALTLACPVAKAAKLLLGREFPRNDVLTAVRSVQGNVTAVVGVEDAAAAATGAADAAEAVSVKRPTLSCPEIVSGPEERASEVLRAFCTRKQWESWEKDGCLVAFGHLSGYAYRIAHRHSALAKAQGRITWNLTAGHMIKAYDWSVPPAEEVLTCKLLVEHAEPWINNPSSNFGGSRRFENPFMDARHQFLDGIPDAGVLAGLGQAIAGIAAGSL